MRLNKLTSLGLAIVVIAGLGLTQTANAITLIPPSLEFNVQPGETITTRVKLFNETTSVVEQYASTANFTAKDETGTPEFVEETTPSDLASWITIGQGPYTLQPGERIEIPVEIKVPANADPGGHFAGILFSPQAPKTVEGSGVAITTKVGSLVLVRVAGEVREQASVASFTTSDGKTNYHRLPVGFNVRVQNSGNVHVRPQGSITIRNMLGGTTTVLPINTAQGAVLPTSTRAFAATWEKDAQVGPSNFFKEFAYEWKNFAFGPYSATLMMSYGQGNDKTISGTLRFMVFPWRVFLVSVLVLGLAIWLIIFLVKRYNRMIIKRAAEANPEKMKK